MSAVLATQPERKFDSYAYSAFMSYATDDDTAWNSWISCFKDELELSLPSVLNPIRVRKVFLSGDTPLVAGRLGPKLKACIEDSYVLFIFVHQNYLLSPWCMQELRFFRSLFGDEGFKDRLYVIAMSETAIADLTNRDEWKELCPFEDQIWVRFYSEDDSDEPMEIYAGTGRGRRVVVAKEFWKMFLQLRKDLADKIRKKVAREVRMPTYPHNSRPTGATGDGQLPGSTVLSPEDAQLVRIYIEGTQNQEIYWESLGKEVDKSWVDVIQQFRVEPQLYLRPTGLAMSEIDARPMLDDADGVVLVWGKKTPDSMAAQIRKLEPKLCGPDYAPGVIAYLMDNPRDAPAASSIGNWRVLRFETDTGGRARVMAEDAPHLLEFLHEVLRRKRG